MERAERSDAVLSEEGRYKLLVEAITDYAVYMLDRDGIVTSWNRGAERFKGYKPAEIIGQHFSRFYTPQDRAAGMPERALRTAATEGRFESEGWRVRQDGSQFWTHVIIDPIIAPDGELIGYAKVTRDLTERRLAEEGLRRSDEQFRRLVNSVTDYAVYMLDTDGYVATWNLGAQRIKGYDPEEIIGQHFSRFYTLEDREAGEPRRALDTAAKVGRFEKEGWRVRKDGSRFWANVVLDAVRDETGRLTGFAKVTRDITEKREAELAIEQAREALFQAQKVEAIGQLTGGIAHDFNNLLMVVLGSLELLRKRLPDEERYVSLLDNAVQGAQRGATLTQRMLAFARRQDLNAKPTNLAELTQGMRSMLERTLGPMMRIATQFPPNLPLVSGDANQLETALLNLVVNARDAMPNGGQITIGAAEETVGPGHRTGLPSGRYVCFSVADQGEGMDEETLARAADPFFTTKGVGKGTGLGLSMVHGLAEQSSGRLTLRSVVGQGSTVEIWLPVSGASSLVMPVAAAFPPPETDREEQKLVVLVVDDDTLVLMNTASLLEDLGHRVYEAHSGREALAILRQDSAINLVISDHAMPQMTGAQLADAIKQNWPALPVILATGYAELPDGLGANLPRLSKPFTQKQLAAVVAGVRAG